MPPRTRPCLRPTRICWAPAPVDLEEVADLVDELRRQFADVVDVVPARFLGRYADQLGVLAGLVLHVQHAHRTRFHPDARIHRIIEQHQGVERIAVAAERVRNEAVVGRIRHGCEQSSIEVHAVRVVIDLVLVATSPRDLDDDVNAARRERFAHAAIVA